MDNMNDNTIISVRHVTFGYRKREPVLEDVSLDVPRGQSLGVLGYNGVGKTTLLNLIIGLLRPQRGRCVINAGLVPAMRDVFSMTERANLIDAMTVRDNIRFRSLLFADRDDPDPVDLDALAEHPLVRAFELGEHLDKKVSDLSSGLRKRAGLVAGMLFDPHVVLLDEPTNAVDPMTRRLLFDYANELRAAGRTLLTVTHDLEYCWRTTDRVVVLDHGHVALDADVAGFADYEAFERAATLGREDRKVDFGIKKTRYDA